MNQRIAPTLFLSCLIASSTACTISPKPVESQSASYSGNEMNSGVIGGCVGGGYIVDDVFRARYISLVKKYAADFPSAHEADLKPMSNGYWFCDKETMADMIAMSSLNRSGILPTKK